MRGEINWTTALCVCALLVSCACPEPAVGATPEVKAAPSAQAVNAPTTPSEHPQAALPKAIHDDFEGWLIAGSEPSSFHVVRDGDVKRAGSGSARLESVIDPGDRFVTLMQRIHADEFLGQRVRFTAYVRTERASRRAGLWMRIDRKDKKTAPFDNMSGRDIKGSTEWKQYAVVLDVPVDATAINFGLLLKGAGVAWLDDAQLEVVDQSVATTDLGNQSPTVQKASPSNMSLDE